MRTFIASTCFTLLWPALWVTASEFPDDYYFAQQNSVRSKLEGQPAIEISTDQWIGDETTLDDCRGKVVVLDFWATWCGPCVASIPKNIGLVRSHPDDIVFIGMHSATSGWDKASQMVDDKEINYPVALDDGETAKAYSIGSYPTYIIIDRRGVIRAAGVKPGSVKTIVEELIGESGSSGQNQSLASFNRSWFYRGSQRMRTWTEQLGQPALPIRAKAWWKPGDAVDAPMETEVQPQTKEDLTGLVRVVHFTRPGMAVTQKQLKLLKETALEYVSQGVDFAVVCDHESDWDKARAFASEIELGIPMALDWTAGSNDNPNDNATSDETVDQAAGDTSGDSPANIAEKPREAGGTAMGYHVRIAPVTVVIDRAGSIRATGLKLEQLDDALDLLLAERSR